MMLRSSDGMDRVFVGISSLVDLWYNGANSCTRMQGRSACRVEALCRGRMRCLRKDEENFEC